MLCWLKFENTKEVIRNRNSKKDTEYNEQKNKDKQTNNDQHNTTQN